MSAYEPLIAVLMIVLFAVLTLAWSQKKGHKKNSPTFRALTGVEKLRKSVGLAVEDGTRVHVSLGGGNVNDPTCPSGLCGLSTLERIGQITATSDLHPMSTSGSGGFQILSRDVINQNAVFTNSTERIDATLCQLSGVTSFAYSAGTLEALRESGVSTEIYLGDFGIEAGLLCESAERRQTYNLAGSNSLTGQAVFLALAKDALIGEEVFALPAYLGGKPLHLASLRAQDLFRFLLVLVLIAGALLKLAGLL